MKISALILTKNEEKMLEDTLRQLTFVDEIIVLDQDSQDKTISIAKKFTDKIFTSKEDNFSKNRNFLAKKANSDWLLYVDADERINQKLQAEIKVAVEKRQYSAFHFPRKNIILGKWLKHGGWWPDYVPRLFEKDALIAWHGKVHESPKIKGEFGRLEQPLTHYTASSIGEMLEKSRHWAKIEAQLHLANKPVKVSSLKILKAVTFEIISRYLLKFGFLDGTVGLIEAIYQGLHRAMVLVYIWEFRSEK